MADKANIQRLFDRYRDGTLTHDGYVELLRHFRLDADAEQLDALLHEAISADNAQQTVSDTVLEDVMDAAHRRIHRRIGKPARRLAHWVPYAAAAAAVLLAVGWLLLDMRKKTTDDRLASTEILPGGNRAVLTLADGRTIDLDEAQTGITVTEEDITYNDGLSSVVMLSANEASVEMLALTTPKGGTYQVTLPDGSKVWLNSASTLKYPSRFSGKERVVTLEGEAYFEIQPELMSPAGGGRDGKSVGRGRLPFKVIAATQTVEVLGTQFNISAYADEEATKTTLVEGKVKVTSGTEKGSSQKGLSDFRTSGLSDYVLTPGQQAITRAAATTINEVDVNQYTAWKSGRFSFAGKPFDQVMRELARWYDIDVRFEGGVPDKALYGGAFRDHDWTSVLLLLETADVDYHMDGRTLTIINKEGGNR